jgi:hypothetical protein
MRDAMITLSTGAVLSVSFDTGNAVRQLMLGPGARAFTIVTDQGEVFVSVHHVALLIAMPYSLLNYCE